MVPVITYQLPMKNNLIKAIQRSKENEILNAVLFGWGAIVDETELKRRNAI